MNSLRPLSREINLWSRSTYKSKPDSLFAMMNLGISGRNVLDFTCNRRFEWCARSVDGVNDPLIPPFDVRNFVGSKKEHPGGVIRPPDRPCHHETVILQIPRVANPITAFRTRVAVRSAN